MTDAQLRPPVTAAGQDGRARSVSFDDRAADEVTLTGTKAAALARARRAGLATLPGVILTTAFSQDVDGGAELATHPALHETFERVDGSRRSLVARSSSVVEDLAGSSMAGQFESVIGIDGLDDLVAAVRAVLDSRARAGAADSPIAVLVQPLIEPAAGGVLFGVDPVSGRSDRRVVTAVAGGPERLVSGEVDGSRYVLDTSARMLEFERRDGIELRPPVLRRLAALSGRVAELFGGPQDVEWALDTDGELWLLQSRPVTTEVRGVPGGPIFGPGPVAETFPEPLRRLEQDLWIPPLRVAVREAVLLAGTATRSQADASELVVAVEGNVAIDLEVTGEVAHRPSIWQRLNPIPAARRLRSAWRIGRLRAALPGLAEDLLDRVDADLESVPKFDELSSRQLLALLGRGRDVLTALHAHEILMGLLTDAGEGRLTGASVALRVLSEARRDGLDDADIVRRSPIVLTLTAPSVGPGSELPPDTRTPDLPTAAGHCSDAGTIREALRLRVRWVQELTGRTAWELGRRLHAAHELTAPEDVCRLTVEELEAIVTWRATALTDIVGETAEPAPAPTPLPACFQLSDLGRPIPVKRANEKGGGTGAGGGIGSGTVSHDTSDPPIGSVLVTSSLKPGLGPLLPRLAGIVSETGSVLAHLAILARESRVPIVVGYAGAPADFPEGTQVIVDGERGEVTIEEEGSP